MGLNQINLEDRHLVLLDRMSAISETPLRNVTGKLHFALAILDVLLEHLDNEDFEQITGFKK